MRAYYYQEDETDPRLPHDSGTAVSGEYLSRLGVLSWHTDLEGVNKIAKERNYSCRDEINISESSFPSKQAYEDKLKIFFTEHLHEDEEIRYVLEGEGYFDCRDLRDRWVRIHVSKDDLVIFPAGIYHRFILTSNDHIRAMRLFQTEPKWVPHNRPEADDNEYREIYVKEVLG